MKLLAIAIVSLLILSGCTHKEIRPQIVVQHTQIDCGVIPNPDPINTLPVEPTIIRDPEDELWVGFTFGDYENMSVNLQSTISHIKGRSAQVKAYRDCIDTFNRTVEEKNQE